MGRLTSLTTSVPRPVGSTILLLFLGCFIFFFFKNGKYFRKLYYLIQEEQAELRPKLAPSFSRHLPLVLPLWRWWQQCQPFPPSPASNSTIVPGHSRCGTRVLFTAFFLAYYTFSKDFTHLDNYHLSLLCDSTLGLIKDGFFLR